MKIRPEKLFPKIWFLPIVSHIFSPHNISNMVLQKVDSTPAAIGQISFDISRLGHFGTLSSQLFDVEDTNGSRRFTKPRVPQEDGQGALKGLMQVMTK